VTALAVLNVLDANDPRLAFDPHRDLDELSSDRLDALDGIPFRVASRRLRFGLAVAQNAIGVLLSLGVPLAPSPAEPAVVEAAL
jgi:hypothetical protein